VRGCANNGAENNDNVSLFAVPKVVIAYIFTLHDF